MNKEDINELRTRMHNHATIRLRKEDIDIAIVVLTARELDELLDLADKGLMGLNK